MLLDNASKYSPAGTTIMIGASRVDHHQAILTVTDEGAGVPVQFRERVFEKFFRIPGREAFDPRRGGVGLGLPIARRLVESQAGTIWMETPENGIGTRVVLMLPTPEGAADLSPPLDVEAASLAH
jgi:NtrC-family two-component system sensor histidine kinase KinB